MNLELSRRMQRPGKGSWVCLSFLEARVQLSAILGSTHILQKVLCLLVEGSWWDMAENAQKIEWNPALWPPYYYDHILSAQT